MIDSAILRRILRISGMGYSTSHTAPADAVTEMPQPSGNLATQRRAQQLSHLAASGLGLPPALQLAAEQRSGMDLSDVRVFRNSAHANDMRAHALTRGADIHLAGGGEPYLPHELWHVVQQKQGRVSANTEFRGQALNTERGLELEANRAAGDISRGNGIIAPPSPARLSQRSLAGGSVSQLAPNQAGTADPQYLIDYVRRLEGEGLSREQILERIKQDHASNDHRYIYTDRQGWVDLRHFGAAAGIASGWGSVITETLGFGNEVFQWASEWGDDYRSGFSPEDIPSNAAGAAFGDDYVSSDEPLSDSLQRWFDDAGGRTQDDPLAGHSSLPATDPSARGGDDRGSSNVSRTKSTVSDNEPVNEIVNEWDRGMRAMSTPEGWYWLFGGY